MKKMAIFLILGCLAYPSLSRAQQKVYPHLQVFLVSPDPERATSFVAFWDGAHKLKAGPFPLKLLERAGFIFSLNLSYAKPSNEVPSSATLKVKTRESPSVQNVGNALVLDQPADMIADRGVSKMFPDAPFLVIGHRAPSEGVLQLGNIMEEIQRKLLACNKEYWQEMEAVLNSVKGMPSFEHASRTIETTFPSCPSQRP